jgi:hypothetical protein
LKINDSNSEWKKISTLEFIGMTLMIPLSIIVFDAVLGFVFRGFAQSNSESALTILLHALYLCLGAAVSIYIYKLRKCFLIILGSCSVLFILYLLLMKTFTAVDTGAIIENILTEIAWIYTALVISVLFFRYTELKLDYAVARDVVEITEKKTNLKFSRGICNKCGQATVVSQEREPGGAKKITFFCDNCGRFIRGNPLTGTAFGLVLISLSILFMYGMNAGDQRSAGATLNLLFAIILYLGIRSFYLGIRSTYKAAVNKDKRNP